MAAAGSALLSGLVDMAALPAPLLGVFLSTESFRFDTLSDLVGVLVAFAVALLAERFPSLSVLESLESESLLVESTDEAELLDLDALLRKGLFFALPTSESSESLDDDDESLLDELLELELDDDELESFGPFGNARASNDDVRDFGLVVGIGRSSGGATRSSSTFACGSFSTPLPSPLICSAAFIAAFRCGT